jgi:hypothetical protein
LGWGGLNDYARARRLVVGGTNGLEQIRAKSLIYLQANSSGQSLSLSLPESFPREWVSVHVPTIVAEMNSRGLDNAQLRAFVLATADYETNQGKFMAEPVRE